MRLFCRLLLSQTFSPQDGLQIFSESLQRSNPLRRSFNQFLFMDEDFPSVAFHQGAQALAHAPAHVAEDLQAVRAGDKEGDAAVAQHADGFGETIEGFQFEAGEVEALELFFRKHRAVSRQQSAKAVYRKGREGRKAEEFLLNSFSLKFFSV